MLIACTADIHLHDFKEFSKQTVVYWDEELGEFIQEDTAYSFPINSRLLDGLNALIQIRKYCVKTNIKVLVIAGDLFHKRGSLSTSVYNNAYRVLESFKKTNIEVFILPGNHDQVSNMDYPENSLYGLKNIANIQEFTNTHTLDSDNSVLFLPFSKSKEVVLAGLHEEIEKLDSIQNCILFAHLGISGSFVGKNNYANKDEFDAEDLCYDQFKYVVLGHYHKPQMIIGTKNMFYCGAPLQHNFNDEGELRGFWVIDTSKRYDIRFKPLDCPGFITVTEDNIEEIEETEGKFIRLQATPANVEDLLSSLQVENVRVELQKKYDKELRSNIDITMSYEDIIKNYAKEYGQTAGLGLEIYSEVITK